MRTQFEWSKYLNQLFRVTPYVLKQVAYGMNSFLFFLQKVKYVNSVLTMNDNSRLARFFGCSRRRKYIFNCTE